MVNEKIKALFVFEVMGRPPEHLKKALEEYVAKLGENKGVEISKKTIHEPKPVEKEGAENLFTTFTEVEIIVDDVNLIFEITLNMLPAHVEIIKPKEIVLKNFDLSGVASNLSIKLHKYDEVAKTITMERSILIKRLQEMQEKINNLEGSVKKDKPKKKGTKKSDKKSKKK
tara:strand:- start:1764 stop:2276 length:513 start_codon:yes stop_codon:yes gene_type:complete